MQKIIIDEEFRMLLPKLDGLTFESLEKNILEHGVRDPLVVWNDILIDGYNRYTIFVSLMTGNLNAVLKSLTSESSIPMLKTSLRTLIDSLEELFESIKIDR